MIHLGFGYDLMSVCFFFFNLCLSFELYHYTPRLLRIRMLYMYRLRAVERVVSVFFLGLIWLTG